MLLDQILLPALWYCTGVLLVVGNICFLYNGNVGVASLGLLMCWCIFSLVAADARFVWVIPKEKVPEGRTLTYGNEEDGGCY